MQYFMADKIAGCKKGAKCSAQKKGPVNFTGPFQLLLFEIKA